MNKLFHNKNAKIGLQTEKIFGDSIQTKPFIIDKLKSYFNIKHNLTNISYTGQMQVVIEYFKKQTINFTQGGFNIGDYLSFQRKGGNGSLSKSIPKNTIEYP